MPVRTFACTPYRSCLCVSLLVTWLLLLDLKQLTQLMKVLEALLEEEFSMSNVMMHRSNVVALVTSVCTAVYSSGMWDHVANRGLIIVAWLRSAGLQNFIRCVGVSRSYSFFHGLMTFIISILYVHVHTLHNGSTNYLT